MNAVCTSNHVRRLALSCRSVLSKHYFLGDFENMLALAIMLEHLPLTLRECYIFATSPTDSADPGIAGSLLNFARAYCKR